MRGHGDSQRFCEAEAMVNIWAMGAESHGFAPKAFASKGFLVYPCYDLSGLANHVRPPPCPYFVPGSYPMSAAHILVVEDNDFVRMQIVRFLKDAGHVTVEAKDGHEALGLMNADIAAAVVDVRMEPMGGLDFIRAVRGRDLETPVILVTGDQTTDLLEQAAKWGVGAVLIKPVVKDRLIKAIERVLVARGT
jgi:CheY-like chemotaxis protein